MSDMIQGLLVVLCPMLLGYLIKLNRPDYLEKINHIVMGLLYLILFLMGYLLGQLEDLSIKLPLIGKTAIGLAMVILTCNLLGLIVYDLCKPAAPLKSHGQSRSSWSSLKDSAKLLSTVIIGAILGYVGHSFLRLPEGINLYFLIVLIFFVGIQLRNSGISVREALFHRRGFYTGVIFTLTTLLGGMLAAYWLALPVTQGLAFASGMGWYSLSSVVIGNAWGPMQGSIAFLNDLLRELVSLVAIPLLMGRFRSAAIGITGATAIDCTLPILQRAGGLEVTSMAISFGFITNILPPFLLVFFSALPI